MCKVKLRNCALVVSIVVLLAATSAASAREGNVSIGAKAAWLDVEMSCGGAKLENSLLAGVVANLGVTETVSIQGELLPIMLTKGAWSCSGKKLGEFNDASIFGIYVVGEAPVDLNFKIHGKVGFAKVSGAMTATSDSFIALLEADGLPTEFEADGAGIALGFGATFNVGNGGAVVAEYSLLPKLEDDYNGKYAVSMISVGYVFRVR